MADDLATIADHVADALDLSQKQISDLLDSAPFYSRLPWEPSSNGTTHKYSKETGAPVVGFRAENSGRDFDHSEDTVVTVNLKILDFSASTDKAVADAWRRGGAPAYIARRSFRHLKASFFKAEQQFFNGTDADSDGFTGFADSTGLDALADTMVYGAGGSTALSSCYLVRLGEDDVSGVLVDGNPVDVGETTVIDMVDGSGKHFPAYYTPGCSWVGMQVGGAYSVGRIANLDASSNGLTDDKIGEGLSLFKAGHGPDLLVMNRRSLKQLQQSRTATNPSGHPAPFPSEAFGVPIMITDAIGNAETAVA